MLRWTNLIGALMLVLMLWAGGAVHAADDQVQSRTMTAEAAGHFDRGGDESRSDEDQGTGQHDLGCDHQAAAPHKAGVAIATRINGPALTLGSVAARSRSPDNHLRPPIA